MYPRNPPPGLLLNLWLRGSRPGILSGMRTESAELSVRIGSREMRGVVGPPLFALKMPPSCHPRSTPAATPWREEDTGICQIALTDAVWVKLKSEGAQLIPGANQNQVVMQFEKASPAMVAELLYIALLCV